MRRTPMFVLAAGLTGALVAPAAPSMAGDLPDRTIVPGDTVHGAIDFVGDVDDAVFDGLKAMKVRVAVTPVTGGPVARAEVLDAWDKMVGPKGRIKPGKFGTVTLKSSGQYRLRVEAPGTLVGDFEILTNAILPKSAKGRTVRVKPNKEFAAFASIDLLRGASLDALVSPVKSLDDVLEAFAVDPNGNEIDLTNWITYDEAGNLVVTEFLAPSTGSWKIKLAGFTSRKQFAKIKLTPTQPVGTSTKTLVECLLQPDDAPVVAPATYTLDPTLLIAPAAGTVGITTSAASGALGSPMDGVRPDVTQINFLSDGDGVVFAPFAVRPADAALPVTVDVNRIALGVVGLHPWVARLDDVQRERFFDAAPSAASFPFLVTAVRAALTEDPQALSDPAKYPEVFRAGDKAARETLALIDWGAPGKRLFSTPWGDFEEPATFNVFGSDSGHAVFVNPRYVFYGVEERGPRSLRRLHLVRPRDAQLHGYPVVVPDPFALGVDVTVGDTEFSADAITDSFDLNTPGGLGNTANALCAVLHIFNMTTPTRFTPADLTELLVNRFTGPNLSPAEQAFVTELADIQWSGTPQQMVVALQQFLAQNNSRNWREIAHALWQWNPNGFAPSAFLHGAGRFLGGYFVTGNLNDSMPFLIDALRVAGEEQLEFCVKRDNLVVVPDCAAPFTFQPDFTWLPTVPAVGDAASFDPAPTTFSAQPPSAPQYVWTFYDAPGEPADVIDNGGSSQPVGYTFHVAGFHVVTLDVTVGGTTSRAFWSVQVESLRNLGFEMGDMSDWTVETHTWYDATPGSVVPGHSEIVAEGFDPIATALPMVFHGNYALRIEDRWSDSYISSATRSLNVPTAGTVLKFAWAAVLEDPQHDPPNQPYFDIKVRDATTDEDLYTIHHYSNEPGFPWQNADAWGSWKYVPWQPVTIDLSGRGGHAITISAIGADCGYGAHGGYVYLDAP
ncbi:MAG: hypothetical protein K8T90_02270 [Planctomycetes bacterium]|nr:hypothetical protein [Planctomycetota bacterium]